MNGCWSCRRIPASACLLLVAGSPCFSQANKLVNTKTVSVSFEVNRGQTSSDVQFVARAKFYTAYLRGGGRCNTI